MKKSHFSHFIANSLNLNLNFAAKKLELSFSILSPRDLLPLVYWKSYFFLGSRQKSTGDFHLKENLQQCTFPLENFLFRHFAIVLTFLFSSSSSSSMQKFFFGFAHKCVRRKLFSINDSKRMAVKKKSIPIKKKIQARKFILFFPLFDRFFGMSQNIFKFPDTIF